MALPVKTVRVGPSPLYFYHPRVMGGQMLVVSTGANVIQWSYNLNHASTPTFGGEVVQILSAYVDSLTISGQTTDEPQLKGIYDWFLAYMRIAGLNTRNEQGLLFMYPERAWKIGIQVTQLPNFMAAVDKIAVEWSINAEVVADPASSLETATRDGFTERLYDPTMFQIGFIDRDPRSDPNGVMQNFGDNFHSLLGAWASGDFAHWAFDALADPRENKLRDSQSYWTNLFGTQFVGGAPSQGSSGSLVLTGSGANATRDAIVLAINGAWEAKGMPGKLGVATAIVESNLNPDARQNGGDGAMGLFQTFPRGHGGSAPHSAEVSAAFNHPNDPVTQFYAAQHQIDDAAGWFPGYKQSDLAQWAKDAQGAGDPAYVSKIQFQLPIAQQLITQAKSSGIVAGSTRSKILHWAITGLNNASRYSYKLSYGRPPSAYQTLGQFPQLMDCSAFVTICYMWAGAPDPNGDHFAGAFTGDMLSHGRAVSVSDAQPGDLLLFADHVGILTKVGSTKDTCQMISMGKSSVLENLANQEGAGPVIGIRSYL